LALYKLGNFSEAEPDFLKVKEMGAVGKTLKLVNKYVKAIHKSFAKSEKKL